MTSDAVRGRVAGLSPLRRRPTPAPLALKAACPDCNAFLQGNRCPWTTSTRRRAVDGVVACDWPYRDMERRVS